jgi:hypothetical protein
MDLEIGAVFRERSVATSAHGSKDLTTRTDVRHPAVGMRRGEAAYRTGKAIETYNRKCIICEYTTNNKLAWFWNKGSKWHFKVLYLWSRTNWLTNKYQTSWMQGPLQHQKQLILVQFQNQEIEATSSADVRRESLSNDDDEFFSGVYIIYQICVSVTWIRV